MFFVFLYLFNLILVDTSILSFFSVSIVNRVKEDQKDICICPYN